MFDTYQLPPVVKLSCFQKIKKLILAELCAIRMILRRIKSFGVICMIMFVLYIFVFVKIRVPSTNNITKHTNDEHPLIDR